MSDIAEILKQVPEVKLKIIPLVWSLVNEKGEINTESSNYSVSEVDLAITEAEEYSRKIKTAINNLDLLLENK